MDNNYKTLRFLAIMLKILATIGLLGIFFITFLGFISQGLGSVGLGTPSLPFALFNSLFPLFFAVLQATVLYSLGELIILFINIKTDLSHLNNKLNN